MKRRLLIGACLATSLGAVLAAGQGAETAASHRAVARNVGAKDWPELVNRLCPEPAPQGAAAARGAAGARGGADAATARGRGAAGPPPARVSPPREQWHAEPVKVFDNLYFVGQTEYSAWAIATSEGIIVIDTIFDYSVEDEVAGGLKKLGLDPAQIKYVIVSHGHGDHSGGAKFLQDTYKARVLMSEADWNLLSRNPNQAQPRTDMVVTDGMKLTLGDTTLTLHLTPGHTPGTVSVIFPVKDNGRPHMMATWGGTAFNFTISPDRQRDYWFKTYIASAQKFRDIARKAGADGMLSNHTAYDRSVKNFPLLAARKPGEPNPYVVGTEAVMRYLTVAEECARAGLAELEGR